MKIHIVRGKLYPKAELNSIHEILSEHIGKLSFYAAKSKISKTKEEWGWDEIFEEVRQYREKEEISDEDYVCFLMTDRNDSNWFSYIHNKNMFIRANGWENFLPCEPKYPIAFQIVSLIIRQIVYDGKIPWHENTIGCINDLCAWKPDIIFKMRTADICLDCLPSFIEKLDKDILEQSLSILESIRQHTLYRGELTGNYKANNNLSELPFPIAITKRKIVTTTDPLRRLLFQIDHFDSLIRNFVIYYSRLLFTETKEWVNDFFIPCNLTSRPSLGTWVAAFSYLTSIKKTNPAINNAALSGEFQRKLSQITSIESRQGIVKMRNEQRGHGYIGCNSHDEIYIKLCTEYGSAILEIEKILLPFFRQYKLAFIKESINISEKEIKYRLLDLSGCEAIFNEFEIAIPVAKGVWVVNKTYIINEQSKEALCLEPYVFYRNCPECQHPRILITDGDLFIDPLIGHRVKIN